MFNNKLNDEVNTIYIILNTNKNISKLYKFMKRKFTSYWYNNLEYTYEHQNDNQCLFKHTVIDVDESENYTIIMYNSSKQPVYTFPCIKNISFRENYIIEEYKINNRLSLCIKDKSIYFVLKYSPYCDIESNIKNIQQCIDNIGL